MNTTTTTSRPVTLNPEQRLYVIPCSSGFSCYGFDNAFEEAAQLAALLNDAAPDRAQWGTLALWERLAALRSAYACRHDLNAQTWFAAKTPAAVRAALEAARISGDRVRVFLGDTTTGRAWLEEWDTVGTIGRSMGPQRVPLLIKSARSHGGGAILTASIVRLVSVKSGRVLYSHPSFHVEPLEARQSSTLPGYASEAWSTEKGECLARFKSADGAANWVAFMRGERMKAA